jgi:hypothetical protein
MPGESPTRLDTLEIVGEVPSDSGWKKRYRYAEPLIAPSLCARKRDQEKRGTSSRSPPPTRP